MDRAATAAELQAIWDYTETLSLQIKAGDGFDQSVVLGTMLGYIAVLADVLREVVQAME